MVSDKREEAQNKSISSIMNFCVFIKKFQEKLLKIYAKNHRYLFQKIYIV